MFFNIDPMNVIQASTGSDASCEQLFAAVSGLKSDVTIGCFIVSVIIFVPSE